MLCLDLLLCLVSPALLGTVVSPSGREIVGYLIFFGVCVCVRARAIRHSLFTFPLVFIAASGTSWAPSIPYILDLRLVNCVVIGTFP